MSAQRPNDAPYFAFEQEVKPIPAEPTLCRGCGAELEPLRRWGGYCQKCVIEWRERSPCKPAAAMFRVVRTFERDASGRRVQHVELECSCGRRRVVKLWTWQNRRPACCNRCRLQAVNDHGFEAEHER